MRRTASILGLAIALVSILVASAAADEICVFDTVENALHCHDSGTTPDEPGDPSSDPDDRPGPRYVYVTTDAVVGDCHYWSGTPGGLDSWDPADDPAVIAANSLPECPVVITPPVDVPGTAWSIFRSWDLAQPAPSLQPASRGITGLPTFLCVIRRSSTTRSLRSTAGSGSTRSGLGGYNLAHSTGQPRSHTTLMSSGGYLFRHRDSANRRARRLAGLSGSLARLSPKGMTRS